METQSCTEFDNLAAFITISVKYVLAALLPNCSISQNEGLADEATDKAIQVEKSCKGIYCCTRRAGYLVSGTHKRHIAQKKRCQMPPSPY
jgi:hypothetical protein